MLTKLAHIRFCFYLNIVLLGVHVEIRTRFLARYDSQNRWVAMFKYCITVDDGATSDGLRTWN